MQLYQAEKLFSRLITTSDEKLLTTFEQWDWSTSRDDAEFEDVAELVSGLAELGVDVWAETEVSHSRLVSLAVKASAESDLSAAADAFILGADPAIKDHGKWQQPLRALSLIHELPRHKYEGYDGMCCVCGAGESSIWSPIKAAKLLPSGYSGEEYEVLANTMFVRWFQRTERPKLNKKNVTFFNKLVKSINNVPANATAVKTAGLLKKEFGGDVYTWRYFMETLGFAGVLRVDRQPGNLQKWVDLHDRPQPRSKNETPSPACHWRRGMGFDRNVFEQLFPTGRLPFALRSTDAA